MSSVNFLRGEIKDREVESAVSYEHSKILEQSHKLREDDLLHQIQRIVDEKAAADLIITTHEKVYIGIYLCEFSELILFISYDHIIIPYHHPVSSSHIIISYHHLISSSQIIIPNHHLVSSSRIMISYHHLISSSHIII